MKKTKKVLFSFLEFLLAFLLLAAYIYLSQETRIATDEYVHLYENYKDSYKLNNYLIEEYFHMDLNPAKEWGNLYKKVKYYDSFMDEPNWFIYKYRSWFSGLQTFLAFVLVFLFFRYWKKINEFLT